MPEDAVQAEGEAADQDAVSETAAAEGETIDFGDEALEPGGGVVAQPERQPVGAFEICGDRCRTDVELKKSFEDGEDDEDDD